MAIEPPTCDYTQYCERIDCDRSGAAALCPDQCSKLPHTFILQLLSRSFMHQDEPFMINPLLNLSIFFQRFVKTLKFKLMCLDMRTAMVLAFVIASKSMVISVITRKNVV